MKLRVFRQCVICGDDRDDVLLSQSTYKKYLESGEFVTHQNTRRITCSRKCANEYLNVLSKERYL